MPAQKKHSQDTRQQHRKHKSPNHHDNGCYHPTHEHHVLESLTVISMTQRHVETVNLMISMSGSNEETLLCDSLS